MLVVKDNVERVYEVPVREDGAGTAALLILSLIVVAIIGYLIYAMGFTHTSTDTSTTTTSVSRPATAPPAVPNINPTASPDTGAASMAPAPAQNQPTPAMPIDGQY